MAPSSFDLTSIRHAMAAHEPGDVWLTFGYNTGVYNVIPRLRGIPNVINMDGMEWTRRRWGLAKQGILLANERLAGWVGDVLIADHPVIADLSPAALRPAARPDDHVRCARGRRAPRPSRSPSSGWHPGDYAHDGLPPDPRELRPGDRHRVVGAERGMPLVVVGPYGDDDPYHVRVQGRRVGRGDLPRRDLRSRPAPSLRFHTALYLHGHTVGGTNPSLVEAMAAGNAIVAHRNPYNTWVAGPENAYFSDADDLAATPRRSAAETATAVDAWDRPAAHASRRSSPGPRSAASTSRPCAPPSHGTDTCQDKIGVSA